jgi:hypothetical protein
MLPPSLDRASTGRALLQGVLLGAAGVAALVALYLLKSALGINLMAGPSPLHDVLYPLVR